MQHSSKTIYYFLIIFPFLLQGCGFLFSSELDNEQVRLEKELRKEKQIFQKKKDREEELALRRLDKRIKEQEKREEERRWELERAIKIKQSQVGWKIKKARLSTLQQQKGFQSELLSGVDKLYRDGLELYKSGQYDMAFEILNSVDELWPDYKLTRNYLAMIEETIYIEKLYGTIEEEDDSVNDPRAIVVSGTLDHFEE